MIGILEWSYGFGWTDDESNNKTGDLCIMAYRKTDMEDKLKDLDNDGKKLGLKINWGKTKEMRINERDNQQLELIDKVIGRVEEFVYLVSIVSRPDGADEDTP